MTGEREQAPEDRPVGEQYKPPIEPTHSATTHSLQLAQPFASHVAPGVRGISALIVYLAKAPLTGSPRGKPNQPVVEFPTRPPGLNPSALAPFL